MNLLGIDYGTRKVGIAKSVDNITFPVDVIPTKGCFQKIKEYCEEFQTDMIVLGLPYHSDGEESEQYHITVEFGEKLEKFLPHIPVAAVEESYTTTEAENFLEEHLPQEEFLQMQYEDDIAAVNILDRFLEINK